MKNNVNNEKFIILCISSLMSRHLFPLLISTIIVILIIPLYTLAEPEKTNSSTIPQPIQEMFQSNLVYPQEKDEIQITLFPSFRKSDSSNNARTLFEVEYGSNNEWDGGNTNELFVTPCIINKLSREWEIGVAVPIGTTSTTDDFRVVGYLMWEFELDEID